MSYELQENAHKIAHFPFADRMIEYIEYEWQHGREPRYSDARALDESVYLRWWNDAMRIGIPRDTDLEFEIREGGTLYLPASSNEIDLRYNREGDYLSWGIGGPTFEKSILERPWIAKFDKRHVRDVIAVLRQYMD